MKRIFLTLLMVFCMISVADATPEWVVKGGTGTFVAASSNSKLAEVGEDSVFTSKVVFKVNVANGSGSATMNLLDKNGVVKHSIALRNSAAPLPACEILHSCFKSKFWKNKNLDVETVCADAISPCTPMSCAANFNTCYNTVTLKYVNLEIKVVATAAEEGIEIGTDNYVVYKTSATNFDGGKVSILSSSTGSEKISLGVETTTDTLDYTVASGEYQLSEYQKVEFEMKKEEFTGVKNLGAKFIGFVAGLLKSSETGRDNQAEAKLDICFNGSTDVTYINANYEGQDAIDMCQSYCSNAGAHNPNCTEANCSALCLVAFL